MVWLQGGEAFLCYFLLFWGHTTTPFKTQGGLHGFFPFFLFSFFPFFLFSFFPFFCEMVSHKVLADSKEGGVEGEKKEHVEEGETEDRGDLLQTLACKHCSFPFSAADDIIMQKAQAVGDMVYHYELDLLDKEDIPCYSSDNPHAERYDVIRVCIVFSSLWHSTKSHRMPATSLLGLCGTENQNATKNVGFYSGFPLILP